MDIYTYSSDIRDYILRTQGISFKQEIVVKLWAEAMCLCEGYVLLTSDRDWEEELFTRHDA